MSRAQNAAETAFWIGRASLLEEVSLFWRLGASLLEEVSYETLVLETWRFTFGGSLVRNAHFGDLALHLWSWTQTWPVCSANVARERAFRSWTQKWAVCSTNVVRERAFRSWTQTWPVCSANVARERACWSWTQTWPVCSANVVRKEPFGAGLRSRHAWHCDITNVIRRTVCPHTRSNHVTLEAHTSESSSATLLPALHLY